MGHRQRTGVQGGRLRVLTYLQRPGSTIATPLHKVKLCFGRMVVMVVVIMAVMTSSLCGHFHGIQTGFHVGQVLLADSNLKPQLSFVSCVTLGKSFDFLLSDYTPTKWASEPSSLCISQD